MRCTPGVCLVLLLVLLLVPAGCISGTPVIPGSGAADQHAGAESAEIPVPGPPSILITYPDFDGGVEAGTVTVTVLVRNFTLFTDSGQKNAPGQGRIVCFRDAVPPVNPGSPAITRPGSFQISDQPWCSWQDVSPGTHTFAVELVRTDNTPLSPPVIDAVDVTAVSAFMVSR